MRRLQFALLIAALASPVSAEVYLSRCRMEECIYYDQTDRKVVADGSKAVPGKLVAVRLRSAAPYGEPQPPISQFEWSSPETARFFCSKTRPAYEDGSGSGRYAGLDMANGVGPYEMVTVMYLHACHPKEARRDGQVDAIIRDLGYRETPRRDYPSFKALIRN